MSDDNKSPNDTLFTVNKWVLDNISPSYVNKDVQLCTKNDWHECFLKKSRKLGNVEDGAALAGELFHLVQISRAAMQK